MSLAFTDIHCHLLPGIDDGAPDWEESLAMARMAAADGIATIVATPHQLGNFARNDGETVRTRCAELQEMLDREGVPLAVWPGADVRIETDMIAKIRKGEVLTLADHRRYVLLELPHEIYLPLDRLLDELRASRLVGVLSHPERNRGILARPEVLPPLVEAGCLMQVTAGSVAGTFGPQIQAFARWMVCEGLVHFLATDAHSCRSRRPLMRRAYEQARQWGGDELAYELCCDNPARVVANQQVAAGRRRPVRRSRPRWFPWRKAG